MKLSEAILLGSTVLSPRAGEQISPERQQGCALGMAAVARGCTFHTVVRHIDDPERRTLGVEGVWGTWILEQVQRPCDCWRIWIRRRMRIKDVIAHLFDYHVMDKKDWSIDQLAGWVRTVEPQEASRRADQRPTVPAVQFERLKQESEEWKAVRQAFELRRTSNKKQRRTES